MPGCCATRCGGACVPELSTARCSGHTGPSSPFQRRSPMPAQVILEFEGVTTKEYDAVNAAGHRPRDRIGRLARRPPGPRRGPQRGRAPRRDRGVGHPRAPGPLHGGPPRPRRWGRADHQPALQRDLDRAGGAPHSGALGPQTQGSRHGRAAALRSSACGPGLSGWCRPRGSRGRSRAVTHPGGRSFTAGTALSARNPVARQPAAAASRPEPSVNRNAVSWRMDGEPSISTR